MNIADLLESAPRPRRRKLRRALIAGVSVLTLAAIGTVAHFGFPAADETVTDAAAAARETARKSLAAFLAAPTPEARAAIVINGDKLLPLMQAWYAARDTDTLSAADFRAPAWTLADSPPHLTALELPRLRGLPPVVACFKRSSAGEWLLDWEIWTQSLDGEFRNFIHKPAEGEHTLRARLTRAGTGDHMAVTIADPFDAMQTISFDITRPDLQALYHRDLPETSSRTATVQLVWLNDSLTGTLQPSLRRHLCWGYPGLDGREPDELVLHMRSKHRPPPGTPAVPPPAPAVLAAAPIIEDAVALALAPTSGALPPRTPQTAPPRETARK